MTPEQLKAIRPRKDDFYSRRLYNWIKWFTERKFSGFVRKPATFWTPESILSRLEVRRYTGKLGPVGELYLLLPYGNDGSRERFLGTRIGCVRRSVRNESYVQFADEFGKPLKNFWRDYIKKGVCLLNPEHRWIDGPTPWVNSPGGKTRHCRWCGLKQRLRSKVVKEIKTWWELAHAA